jgi:hypothetical protein
MKQPARTASLNSVSDHLAPVDPPLLTEVGGGRGVGTTISWDSQEMDCDNARATTLSAAKAIPYSYEVDAAQQVLIAGSDSSGIALASFLYGNEAETGPYLEIPAGFTDSE